MQTPSAELPIDQRLVEQLLVTQHPDLAQLPVEYLTEGWDNIVYRLGDQYLVRLPRRAQAVPFILREQRWLPQLAPTLPIAVPSPLRVGQPQGDYPWPWSITPWFSGQVAAEALPLPTEATLLARFLKTLHRKAPSDAPHNPFRAVPLSTHTEKTIERLRQFSTTKEAAAQLTALWLAALSAQESPADTRLIHADLHPKNVITRKGRISAIIDWGDMTAGDPATDLASFWMLFADQKARREGLVAYVTSPQLLARAKGWALFFGTLLLAIGQGGDPAFEKIGRFTLNNLVADNF